MKILAISSHMDDAELGCGGTLAKLIQQGHEVFYLGLSDCNNPSLTDECLAATRILGIEKHQLCQFDHRIMCLNRQGILETLLRIKRSFNPDIVFTHGSTDFHQDHKTVYEESIRAFKDRTIFGYSFPWNSINQIHHMTVSIDIEKKIYALSMYKSQQAREYFNPDYIRAINYTGEHFEVIKLTQSLLCVG